MDNNKRIEKCMELLKDNNIDNEDVQKELFSLYFRDNLNTYKIKEGEVN